MAKQNKSRGRPSKFDEPARPVTTTLPESTIRQLESVHSDRALAIVKAAALATHSGPGQSVLVDVVEVVPGYAVIVVGPSKSLRRIKWLRLIEIAPGRFLMLLPTGMALETLEVAVTDLLENLDPKETYERELLTALYRILSQRRRQQDISKAELVLLRVK
jgi:hypothetical protein